MDRCAQQSGHLLVMPAQTYLTQVSQSFLAYLASLWSFIRRMNRHLDAVITRLCPKVDLDPDFAQFAFSTRVA